MKRRLFLIAPLLAAAGRALAALRPTPAQAEGPFYPVEPIPLREDLTDHAGGAAAGEYLNLLGRVRNLDGRPLKDVRIEIWQCDAAGRYRHPRDGGDAVDPHFAGFGATLSSAAGDYRFQTLLPVPYGSRPPHIHVKLHQHGRERLTSQLYLRGREREGGLFGRLFGDRSALLLEPASLRPQRWQAEFDFVLDDRV